MNETSNTCLDIFTPDNSRGISREDAEDIARVLDEANEAHRKIVTHPHATSVFSRSTGGPVMDESPYSLDILQNGASVTFNGMRIASRMGSAMASEVCHALSIVTRMMSGELSEE